MRIDRACEVCGHRDAEWLLESEKLDGPLVRCRECGFVFVGWRREDFTFKQADSAKSMRLAERVRDLQLRDSFAEEAEIRWRRVLARERLAELRHFQPGRRLLEIGCAEGEFIANASADGYHAIGLEADPGTSLAGRGQGLDIRTGTLREAGFEGSQFDVVAMYHVVEHLDSPRETLTEICRVLAPGGLLALETPNVDTVWFSLLRGRWRQLIPDHYFFFSPRTIIRLLEGCGFSVLKVARVGKPMSLRLFLDRVRRMNRPIGSAALSVAQAIRIENLTLRINLGDIMRVHARRI